MKRFDATSTVYTPTGDKALLPAPVEPNISTREQAESVALWIWIKATMYGGGLLFVGLMICVFRFKWDIVIAPLVSLGAMLVAFVALFLLVGIPALEEGLGIDINGDKQIGNHPPQVYKFKLEVNHKHSGRTSFLDIVTNLNVIRSFCEEALKDRTSMASRNIHTTTEENMEAHGVPKTILRKIREQMIGLEYARWDGAKNGGWSITEDGEEWIKDWLSKIPSPT